eukprot:TRINITY_DN413_c0_g1_i1.p1 TRINITY_DN413_c0_g1~~TRINITY_DN413_c0_g1_i1.p1  ORF type:complete len:1611 (-),score=416.00 TRINITY_DN413_c0_g1_i1:60-4892(-)
MRPGVAGCFQQPYRWNGIPRPPKFLLAALFCNHFDCVMTPVVLLHRTSEEASWEENAIAFTQLLDVKGPLCVCSVTGECRSDKERLLNALLGLDANSGFPSDEDQQGQSIWMWISPIPRTDGSTVVVFDTRGLFDRTSFVGKVDGEFLAFSILASSVTLVVLDSSVYFDSHLLEKLRDLSEVSKYLRLKDDETLTSDVRDIAPDLMLVVRSTASDGQDDQEYLEQQLQPHQDATHSLNQCRRSLSEMFPRRASCRLPHTDLEDIAHSPDFVQKLQDCRHRMQAAPIKTLPFGVHGAVPVNGILLVSFLQGLIQTRNNVSRVLSSITQSQTNAAKDIAEQLWTSHMQSQKGLFPVDAHELLQISHQAQTTASQAALQHPLIDKDELQQWMTSHFAQWRNEKLTGGLLMSYWDLNVQLSDKLCRDVMQRLVQSSSIAQRITTYSSLRDFDDDCNHLFDKYQQEARGPARQPVLDAMLQESFSTWQSSLYARLTVSAQLQSQRTQQQLMQQMRISMQQHQQQLNTMFAIQHAETVAECKGVQRFVKQLYGSAGSVGSAKSDLFGSSNEGILREQIAELNQQLTQQSFVSSRQMSVVVAENTQLRQQLSVTPAVSSAVTPSPQQQHDAQLLVQLQDKTQQQEQHIQQLLVVERTAARAALELTQLKTTVAQQDRQLQQLQTQLASNRSTERDATEVAQLTLRLQDAEQQLQSVQRQLADEQQHVTALKKQLLDASATVRLIPAPFTTPVSMTQQPQSVVIRTDEELAAQRQFFERQEQAELAAYKATVQQRVDLTLSDIRRGLSKLAQSGTISTAQQHYVTLVQTISPTTKALGTECSETVVTLRQICNTRQLELAEAAAGALFSLSACRQNIAELQQLNSVEVTLSVLKQYQDIDAILVYLTGALAQLVTTDQVATAMKYQAMELVIPCVISTKKQVASNAVDALRCLTVPGTLQSIAEAKGIVAIVQAMENFMQDGELLNRLTKILQQISELEEAKRVLIARANGVPVILDVMRSHTNNLTLVKRCALILSGMMENNEEETRILFSRSGGFSVCVKVLEAHPGNDKLQASILSVLINALRTHSEVPQRARECSVTQTVVALLRSYPHTAAMQARGLKVLMNICISNTNSSDLQFMTDLGAVQSIIDGMRTFPDDEDVQMSATGVLINICTSKEDVERLRKLDVHKLVITACSRHPPVAAERAVLRAKLARAGDPVPGGDLASTDEDAALVLFGNIYEGQSYTPAEVVHIVEAIRLFSNNETILSAGCEAALRLSGQRRHIELLNKAFFPDALENALRLHASNAKIRDTVVRVLYQLTTAGATLKNEFVKAVVESLGGSNLHAAAAAVNLVRTIANTDQGCEDLLQYNIGPAIKLAMTLFADDAMQIRDLVAIVCQVARLDKGHDKLLVACVPEALVSIFHRHRDNNNLIGIWMKAVNNMTRRSSWIPAVIQVGIMGCFNHLLLTIEKRGAQVAADGLHWLKFSADCCTALLCDNEFFKAVSHALNVCCEDPEHINTLVSVLFKFGSEEDHALALVQVIPHLLRALKAQHGQQVIVSNAVALLWNMSRYDAVLTKLRSLHVHATVEQAHTTYPTIHSDFIGKLLDKLKSQEEA